MLLCGCGGGGGFIDDCFCDDPFFDDLPPLIANPDNYSTLQNQPLAVGDANGVLANDVFFDATLRFPNTTASGGTLAGRPDGSFNYTPPQNFTGTDFFDYTLEDDFGIVMGNVIIAVNAPGGSQNFVVDSQNGNDATGSGSSGAPFASIQAALNAAGNNGIVVVRPGNGQAYTGAVNLLNGQTLVGSNFTSSRAQTTAVRPLLTGPVTMADGCTVRGLRIENSSADAIEAAGRNGGNVSECQLVNSAQRGLDLTDARGSWNVSDNQLQNNPTGIAVSCLGNNTLTCILNRNTITSSSQNGASLTTSDTAQMQLRLRDNIFNANQSGSTLILTASGTASLCLDMTGNQSDDIYRFTRNGALFQVEQLSQLANLNTGSLEVSADPLMEVSDGFCGF